MKLIIGLGNPGKKYEKTRHNVGFLLLDEIAEKLDLNSFEEKSDFSSLVSMGTVGNDKVLLAKPQTFMNNSGQAVSKILSYYSEDFKKTGELNPEDLIVIHDDVDIELGKYKIQNDKSSAGHNGVQSIIDQIGTQDFYRARVGIFTPQKEEFSIATDDFVLSPLSSKDIKVIENVGNEILDWIRKMI